MIAIIPFVDTRRTGYQFGQKIQLQHAPANTHHCGLDANQGNSGGADEGLPVIALADGEVVYAKASGAGWGNLVVIEHPELSKLWPTGYIASRCAHFKSIKVKVGDKVKMGDVIGFCGKTGTQSPHCHEEVIQKKLPSHTHYPNGKGLQYVREYWVDPEWFVKEINKIYVEKSKDPEWFKVTREYWKDLIDVDGFIQDFSPYRTLEAIRKAIENDKG